MDYRALLVVAVAISASIPQWQLPLVEAQVVSIPGSASYEAPAGFPTSIFSSYYVKPAPTQEPQPIIYDEVLGLAFPFNLTDPKNIPTSINDPIYYPEPIGSVPNASASAFVQTALGQIREIITGNSVSGNCSKCIAALEVGKLVAEIVPTKVPSALIELCQAFAFSSNSSCQSTYAAGSLGSIWTQVLALADVSGQDGLYICNSLSSTFCAAPATNELNTTGLFPKPKPANASKPRPSGKKVKVLHLSDMHLDPRYYASSEANCSSSFCCRTNVKNAGTTGGQISLPASLYGAYKCDVPYDMVTAVLQALGPLSGVAANESFAWSLYTGDLVAHDSGLQMSRAYIEYAETSVYGMLKTFIKGPVFAALGNHDTSPIAIDAAHILPGPLGRQYTWNYEHVSALWKHEGWIDEKTAAEARLHYGAYSILNHYGLRIITLNTDFWYRSNILNFINTTNPDVSGMLAFLILELQAAEDAGERVWIIGHVLSGWDGTNPLPNPTNLFYQIVDRYSPHVIANIMWGHTHEDELTIFYANNGTVRNADTALTQAWIGPSVTPLTNLNSGFRLYEVDTGTFDVHEAYTFFAEVSSFSALNGTDKGPTFTFEYSTRNTYLVDDWPVDAPLNATYWHAVTEMMERNHTLVALQNKYQGKSSMLSPNCTSDACAAAKVCYMRSGSVPLGRKCPQG